MGRMTEFNSYFVKLDRPGSIFSAKVDVAGRMVPVSFKFVHPGFFIAFFKTPVPLRFLERLNLGAKRDECTVLLPVLSEHNQRRLRKICAMLEGLEKRDLADVLAQMLEVEKFLELGRLLDFFSLTAADAAPLLARLEIEKRIKVITYHDLLVTAYGHFQESLQKLSRFLAHCFEKRLKSVPLGAVEKAIKIPQHSIFFHYLVQSLAVPLSFRVQNDVILCQRFSSSDEEKNNMAAVERALKKNKMPVFAISDAVKVSGLEYRALNDALWYMADEQTIIQISESHFVFEEELQKIVNRLKKFKRNQGDLIGIADLRELTGLSRKYILMLFTYFDALGFTRRQGNQRKILLSA